MKRVAVVGAGVCGLAAIKCCLDEGLEPVCLERTGHFGGLWVYEEDSARDGHASVTKTTVLNSSKELTAYSDFLIPKNYANYMHNSKFLTYLGSYVEHFGLQKHITYQQEVIYITKAPKFEQHGRWNVQVKDLETGIVRDEVFDAVMVCTGHHAFRNTPEFPGHDIFQGQQIHSGEYRNHKGYEDKRVVVIGVGNSGGDLATDLAGISKQVFLSTRRGAWVDKKMAKGAVPGDLTVHTRLNVLKENLLPSSLYNALLVSKMEQVVDHEKYGLRPEHPPTAHQPITSTELVGCIATGNVIVKPDIKRLTTTGVEFTDGTYEDDIDVIFYATGYVYDFPFIDKAVINVKDTEINLFKLVFSPELTPPTLALIGFVQPFLAPFAPVAELQCRWATQVFKGTCSLPSRADMLRDIRQMNIEKASRYVNSRQYALNAEWIPYMDEIAEQAGCKPNLWRMLLTDPRLALTCFFGPCSPYQYRLEGPKSWVGARQAILSQWERIDAPTRTRQAHASGWTGRAISLLQYAILGVLFAIFFFFLA